MVKGRGVLGFAALYLGLLYVIAGCNTVGPGSVGRDRFDYNTTVANSWKEQTLLNIVRLRYADMPLFMDVASIVAGYTFESKVAGGANFTSIPGDSLQLGAEGRFTDRPTITYTPITGQQFNRSFMRPVPPAAVLFLLQSGWHSQLVLPLTVKSINGLRSRDDAGLTRFEGDPGYYEAIDYLGRLQLSNAIDMQVFDHNNRQEALFVVHRDNLRATEEEDLSALLQLLNLDPSASEFRLVYGSVQNNGDEIAMLTRSMLHLMIDMAAQVRVPEDDVRAGRTIASTAADRGPGLGTDLLDIKWSSRRPDTAFTAVKYRDRWFYIDDRDYDSKRSFTFLMLLNSLLETSGREMLPLVTIPSR